MKNYIQTDKGFRLHKYVCPSCKHVAEYPLPDNARTTCNCPECGALFTVDTRQSVILPGWLLAAVVLAFLGGCVVVNQL